MTHPQRCETCQNCDRSGDSWWYCNFSDESLEMLYAIPLIEQVGCASHSSAPVPEGYILTTNDKEHRKGKPNPLTTGTIYDRGELSRLVGRNQDISEQSIRQDEREKAIKELRSAYEAMLFHELRPHILYFALRMEEKLRKHDKERGERGWVGYSQPEEQQYLFNRLTEEVKELEVEIKRRESVVEKFGEFLVNSPSESIDVGNFAMMIYTALYSDETCGGMIKYMLKELRKQEQP